VCCACYCGSEYGMAFSLSIDALCLSVGFSMFFGVLFLIYALDEKRKSFTTNKRDTNRSGNEDE
jgi:hypothetical protein